MRVRYTATALAEVTEVLSYIARDNPRAAAEVRFIVRNVRRTHQLAPWDRN